MLGICTFLVYKLICALFFFICLGYWIGHFSLMIVNSCKKTSEFHQNEMFINVIWKLTTVWEVVARLWLAFHVILY